MQWEGKNGPTWTKLLVNARVNGGANPNHILIARCTATLDVSNVKLIRKGTNSKVSKLKSFRNLCRNWAPAIPNFDRSLVASCADTVPRQYVLRNIRLLLSAHSFQLLAQSLTFRCTSATSFLGLYLLQMYKSKINKSHDKK